MSGDPMGPLWNTRTREIVATRLEVADGYWSRLLGLQFRSALPPGSGLLLIPCRSIHTAFCRFAIDVVALDRTGRVVDVRRSVRPWSVVVPTGEVHAILELNPDACEIAPGDVLRVEATDSAQRRSALEFLQPRSPEPDSSK